MAPTRGNPILPQETKEALRRASETDNFALAMRRFIGPDECNLFTQKHQMKVLEHLERLSKSLATSTSEPSQAAAGLVKRSLAMAAGCPAWVKLVGKVAWRMVAGLGSAGILEGSGMTLHPLYGFPYIPGSSVKGLCRAVALEEALERNEEQLATWVRKKTHTLSEISRRVDRGDLQRKPDPKELDREAWDALQTISRVFGSQRCQGEWIFFDALPGSFPPLEVDIVNPHFGKYYQEEKQAPADWLDPSPVYFLTVAQDTQFVFLSGATAKAAGRDLEHVERWMKVGLQEWGVGAKTSTGYGLLTKLTAEHEAS